MQSFIRFLTWEFQEDGSKSLVNIFEMNFQGKRKIQRMNAYIARCQKYVKEVYKGKNVYSEIDISTEETKTRELTEEEIQKIVSECLYA